MSCQYRAAAHSVPSQCRWPCLSYKLMVAERGWQSVEQDLVTEPASAASGAKERLRPALSSTSFHPHVLCVQAGLRSWSEGVAWCHSCTARPKGWGLDKAFTAPSLPPVLLWLSLCIPGKQLLDPALFCPILWAVSLLRQGFWLQGSLAGLYFP